MATCLPFLRVPDISEAITWYQNIGFTCISTHQEPGCPLDWALLDLSGAQFMLYPEGRTKYDATKDAGLYFQLDSVDEFKEVIQQNAKIIEITPQTEYGKKEIVFHDLNGFQVTFGCEPDGN